MPKWYGPRIQLSLLYKLLGKIDSSEIRIKHFTVELGTGVAFCHQLRPF